MPRMRSEEASCRVGAVGSPEWVSRVYPGTIERAALACAFLARRKSPTKPQRKEQGYRNATEASEVIAPQIPAQTPSDRSNVAIKHARVGSSWSSDLRSSEE
jgi:hypothetical protein